MRSATGDCIACVKLSKSRSAGIEVKEELGQDGETVSEYGTLGYKKRVPVVIGEGEFCRVTLGHYTEGLRIGEKCVMKAFKSGRVYEDTFR